MEKVKINEILHASKTIIVCDKVDKSYTNITINDGNKSVTQKCNIGTPNSCFSDNSNVSWIVTDNNKMITLNSNIVLV